MTHPPLAQEAAASALGVSRDATDGESGEYLIFVTYGFPELEFDDSMDPVFVMRDVERFASPSDGPFSAFQMIDGVVQDWAPQDGKSVSLEKAISIIKRLDSK